MKLVLFFCLVVVGVVVAEVEAGEKRFPYPNCFGVNCNNCYYSLHDCYDCCRDFLVDCRLINCYECDIKYCGQCCLLAKESATVS